MTHAAIATLIIGIIIGYMGQRSRMCFIGGIRDFILVRDTFLLKGVIAFGLTAWVAFPIFGLSGGAVPGSYGSTDLVSVVIIIVGGFGVGYLSTLANGCPFRQHVLAAQGMFSSMTYLAGFFVGAVVFHSLVIPILSSLLS